MNVISVASIVATLVGVMAVWRTNGPFTNALVELASLAQAGLEAAEDWAARDAESADWKLRFVACAFCLEVCQSSCQIGRLRS